eukprot:1854530-Rhodomonas_salina.2
MSSEAFQPPLALNQILSVVFYDGMIFHNNNSMADADVFLAGAQRSVSRTRLSGRNEIRQRNLQAQAEVGPGGRARRLPWTRTRTESWTR